MCSQAADRGDLTARAVIRNEALRLFAERGPEAVSMRQVAAAAGVSPGLVVHHFGSRAGLREAVDAHVAAVFDGLVNALAEADWSDTEVGASFVAVVLAQLPAGSPILGYLRWLLLSGDPAGTTLFLRWHLLTGQVLDQMTAAGIIRPSPDPPARAAFLLVNDLAALLMHEHLTAALGDDPLSEAGMARWTDSLLDVYRNGLFTAAQTPDAASTPPLEER